MGELREQALDEQVRRVTSEVDRLAETAAFLQQERGEALCRCRTAAQTLIEEIGAPGPESLEETAARAVVAELDPAVTGIAKARLFLDTDTIEVLHTDARIALAAAAPASYDFVVGDVFHDVALPYHLTTQEYAALVHSRLSADGLYVLNVVDAFPDPRLVKSIVKTLATQFRYVDVWLDRIPDAEDRVTYVISAGDGFSPPVELESTHGLVRKWLRVTEPLLNTGTPVDDLPVLTDDYVPVERLVSRLLLRATGN